MLSADYHHHHHHQSTPITIMTTGQPATTPNELERISISLEQLQSNFVVSMKEFLKRPGSEKPSHEEEGDDVEEEEEEAEVDDEPDFIEKHHHHHSALNETKRVKKKKETKKAPKLEDYDINDPFIDDSEMTAVYESVFDLMMKAEHHSGEDATDEEGIDVPEREQSTEKSKRALTAKDFYVYRGPIEIELVEKYCFKTQHFVYSSLFREFDEPKRRKKKKTKKPASKKADKEQQQQQQQSDKVDSSQPSLTAAHKKDGERSRKRKNSFSDTPSLEARKADKKVGSSTSLTERLQQLEAEIEEREGKLDDVAMNDEPDDESKVGNVRRFYDIDKEVIRLEVLDAFEKFKETAAKISEFDQTKFPTALRTSLERYIIASLKRDNDVLEESVLTKVSSLVPYSALALRRLLLKKIFPLLIESLGQVRPEIIRTRIREEINAILSSEATDTETTAVIIDPITDEQKAEDNAKKGKKRKWTVQLKQLVFEYLKCASERSLLLRAVRANSEDPTSRPIPSSLSETALRRSAYRELVGCWANDEDKWPMTSSELSRECSSWKKKYERTLLKEHNVDIEQFLVIVEKPDKAILGNVDAPNESMESMPHTTVIVALPSDPLQSATIKLND